MESDYLNYLDFTEQDRKSKKYYFYRCGVLHRRYTKFEIFEFTKEQKKDLWKKIRELFNDENVNIYHQEFLEEEWKKITNYTYDFKTFKNIYSIRKGNFIHSYCIDEAIVFFDEEAALFLQQFNQCKIISNKDKQKYFQKRWEYLIKDGRKIIDGIKLIDDRIKNIQAVYD